MPMDLPYHHLVPFEYYKDCNNIVENAVVTHHGGQLANLQVASSIEL